MNRRGFLASILAAATAPAFARFDSLMRPRVVAPAIAPFYWVEEPILEVPTYFPGNLLVKQITQLWDYDYIDATTFYSQAKSFARGLSRRELEVQCLSEEPFPRGGEILLNGQVLPGAYVREVYFRLNCPAEATVIIPYSEQASRFNFKQDKLSWRPTKTELDPT